MRWTLNALSDVQWVKRTAKACGPGALAAGAKFCGTFRKATVTQKPVSPGRARDKPLTPLRRECRCFGFSCSDYAHVLPSHLHVRLWVRLEHLAFPAPSRLRGRPTQDSGEISPRECGLLFHSASLRGAKRRSNLDCSRGETLDWLASLAMTARS